MCLIETVRVEEGRAPLWPLHRHRLMASAQSLGVTLPSVLPSASDVALCGAEVTGPAAVRLTVNSSGIRMDARAVPPVVGGWRACSVPLLEASIPFRAHKTTLRSVHEAAREYAKARRCEEAIWVTKEGLLTEGTITNLFVSIGGYLYTPHATGDNLLPGIARGRLLAAGFIAGRPISEANLLVSDLVHAEEVFCTNAVRGAIPVLELDNEALGRGDLWREASMLIFAPL